jgi:hypothetical protein
MSSGGVCVGGGGGYDLLHVNRIRIQNISRSIQASIDKERRKIVAKPHSYLHV